MDSQLEEEERKYKAGVKQRVVKKQGSLSQKKKSAHPLQGLVTEPCLFWIAVHIHKPGADLGN